MPPLYVNFTHKTQAGCYCQVSVQDGRGGFCGEIENECKLVNHEHPLPFQDNILNQARKFLAQR